MSKHSAENTKRWKATRAYVLKRDQWTCQWCGIDLTHYDVKATVDHVTPKAHGGTDTADNLVAACFTCNSSRGARSQPRRRGTDRYAPKKIDNENERPIFGDGRPRGRVEAGLPPSEGVDSSARWTMTPKGGA